MIPYSRQNILKKDIKAVVKVLKSNFLTQGPMVGRFEKKICDIVGSKHAVATNSATSALHIACLSLGLKKGDYLWTSANTFVASANCAKYCGANVKFLDIDKNTYNLSYTDLLIELKKAKIKRQLPKILVVVHFAGLPAEMAKIKVLSKKYNFKIIEDASHALGSSINNQLTGNCKFSDICVFSFHPVKIITSGEGGMATTNDILLKEKMLQYREHGIERFKTSNKNKSLNKWYYEQQTLGYNYRMSDIHAALGLSQLSRLKNIIKKRNKLADNYFKLLKKFPLKLPYRSKKNLCSFHLFIIQMDKNKTDIKRNTLFSYLRKKKIYTNLHYIPVNTHPFYFKLSNRKMSNVISYSNNALSIPIYETLNYKLQKKIVSIIKKGLKLEK